MNKITKYTLTIDGEKFDLASLKSIRGLANDIMITKLDGTVRFFDGQKHDILKIKEGIEFKHNKDLIFVQDRFININQVKGLKVEKVPARKQFDLIVTFNNLSTETFYTSTEQELKNLYNGLKEKVEERATKSKSFHL